MPKSIVLLAFLLISCTSKPISGQQTEYVPELPWNNRDWTLHTIDEIDVSKITTITPSDVSKYCPEFKRMNNDQKVEFYVHLLSRIAERESSFNPDAFYVECSSSKSTYGKRGIWNENLKKWCLPGSKADGGLAVSRGLFQLSLGSSEGYDCAFIKPEDLHDPFWNITCAVIIADRWLVNDKVISGGKSGAWRGLARYWSVMRSSSSSMKVIRDHSLNFCKSYRDR